MPKLKPGPLVRRPDGPDPLENVLTVREAMQLTGLTHSGIHNRIRRGLLPACRRGHLCFIPRDLTSALQNPLAGLITVAEAAALTGLTVHGVHYSVQRGILPAWHRGGIFLLPRAEVEAWHARKQAEKAGREG